MIHTQTIGTMKTTRIEIGEEGEKFYSRGQYLVKTEKHTFLLRGGDYWEDGRKGWMLFLVTGENFLYNDEHREWCDIPVKADTKKSVMDFIKKYNW